MSPATLPPMNGNNTSVLQGPSTRHVPLSNKMAESEMSPSLYRQHKPYTGREHESSISTGIC